MQKEIKDKFEEFENLVEPICKYIKENYNPHTTIIVTDNFARIVEDIMQVPLEK